MEHLVQDEAAMPAIGPYMLQELAEELPLDTSEQEDVEITCVEAREDNLYIGTSAHEILHFVSIPPSSPATPHPLTAKFPSQRPTYILASRIQPPLAISATSQGPLHFIKQIILLPGSCKVLVLSSTGVLSFWTFPELSPAQGSKVKNTNFIGGLDINELEREEAEVSGAMGDESGSRWHKSKLVMILGKTIRMVRVREEELRVMKDIHYPSYPPLVSSTRRGAIACIATTTDYALIDVENTGRIPLFSILSSDPPQTFPGLGSGSTAIQEEQPESDAPQSSPSPIPPSASEGSDTDGNQKVPISRRASSSSASSARAHPPRSSSLHPRPRSEVISPNATLKLPVADDSGKHTRSVSAGSIKGGSVGRAVGKASPLSREGSVASGRRTPQGELSGRVTPSPNSTVRRASTKASPSSTPQQKLSIPSRSSKPPSISRSSTPTPSTGRAPSPKPHTQPPKSQQQLKPHVQSPTPHEFLLTTGTSMSDPGVGMFVDLNGDPTRGTISFSKYPDQILLDGGWVIALLVGNGNSRLELIPWLDDLGRQYPKGQENFISLDSQGSSHKPGIGKVLKLPEMMVENIGSLLKLERVRLADPGSVTDQEEWEVQKSLEELEVAVQIAKVRATMVVFKGKKIWRLIPSPIAVRLDSRLPSPTFASTSREIGDQRRASILAVLKQLDGLEPTTMKMFHEISYIKQKCGILLLSEFLRLLKSDDEREFPAELLATETALIEGSLDPRVVVSLFPGFEDELKEGQNGVWVYGGIKNSVEILLKEKFHISSPLGEVPAEDWAGRRDILLLLKRYLSAWRQKKGFGSVSQADEKEVFWTIDATLIHCLLALEATRPSPVIKHLAGETDLRQELYKIVDYPPSIECYDRAVYLLERFKRLYVLSILYQSKKMSREVLNTWKRILESDDPKVRSEFPEGEEKVAEYLLARKDRELVREYGTWLAQKSPSLGIKVFADENARVKWEPEQVLPLLKQEAPESVRHYVEHLVVRNKDLRYANDLLLIYLDSLVATLSSSPDAIERLRSSCEAYRALNLPKPTYRQFLQDNTLSFGEEDWWINRLRLLDLLESASDNAEVSAAGGNVEEVLEKLEPYSDVLIAEMVLLCTMAGRHENSIKLLVHELRDFDGCAEYCLYGGEKRTANSTRMKREQQEMFFGVFLTESLKIGEWTVCMEWVERILDKWGAWLDVVQVLSVIPDSYSVSILSNFLITALRRLVKEKSESVVIKSIRRGENLRVNAEYVDKVQGLSPIIQTAEGAASF